jgi:hypothetical protein
MERESSLQNVMFLKRQGMGNVQNCDGYIKIASSQTYRSYKTVMFYLMLESVLPEFDLYLAIYSNIAIHKQITILFLQ